jgi:hypothetical protein
MAAVRYTWMFRTAAVLYLVLGASWLWTATMVEKWAAHRPWLVALGAASVLIAVFLFRRAKAAIVLSAVGAAFLAIVAAVAAPRMHGPGILFLAGLAIVAGLYAALAIRAAFADGR